MSTYNEALEALKKHVEKIQYAANQTEGNFGANSNSSGSSSTSGSSTTQNSSPQPQQKLDNDSPLKPQPVDQPPKNNSNTEQQRQDPNKGNKKPSVWHDGYEYTWDEQSGAYVRWAMIGGKPIPFSYDPKTNVVQQQQAGAGQGQTDLNTTVNAQNAETAANAPNVNINTDPDRPSDFIVNLVNQVQSKQNVSVGDSSSPDITISASPSAGTARNIPSVEGWKVYNNTPSKNDLAKAEWVCNNLKHGWANVYREFASMKRRLVSRQEQSRYLGRCGRNLQNVLQTLHVNLGGKAALEAFPIQFSSPKEFVKKFTERVNEVDKMSPDEIDKLADKLEAEYKNYLDEHLDSPWDVSDAALDEPASIKDEGYYSDQAAPEEEAPYENRNADNQSLDSIRDFLETGKAPVDPETAEVAQILLNSIKQARISQYERGDFFDYVVDNWADKDDSLTDELNTLNNYILKRKQNPNEGALYNSAIRDVSRGLTAKLGHWANYWRRNSGREEQLKREEQAFDRNSYQHGIFQKGDAFDRAMENEGYALVKPEELALDPKRFQFKMGTNEEGVTDKLKGTKKFSPDTAGTITVWHDPENGMNYIVNGHHRFELANRTGYTGLLNVRFIDAANADEARSIGALVNIMDETGTVWDAAKFMKGKALSEQQAQEIGINLNSKLFRDARSIMNLSDNVYNEAINGSDEMKKSAIEIGKILQVPPREEGQTDEEYSSALKDVHSRISSVWAQGKKNGFIEDPIRMALLAGLAKNVSVGGEGEQGSLFDFADPQYKRTLDVLLDLQQDVYKKFREDKRDLGVFSRKNLKDSAQKLGVGTTDINREDALSKKETTDAIFKQLAETLNQGEILETLNQAAEEIINAQDKGDRQAERSLRARTVESITRLLSGEGGQPLKESGRSERKPRDIRPHAQPSGIGGDSQGDVRGQQQRSEAEQGHGPEPRLEPTPEEISKAQRSLFDDVETNKPTVKEEPAPKQEAPQPEASKNEALAETKQPSLFDTPNKQKENTPQSLDKDIKERVKRAERKQKKQNEQNVPAKDLFSSIENKQETNEQIQQSVKSVPVDSLQENQQKTQQNEQSVQQKSSFVKNKRGKKPEQPSLFDSIEQKEQNEQKTPFVEKTTDPAKKQQQFLFDKGTPDETPSSSPTPTPVDNGIQSDRNVNKSKLLSETRQPSLFDNGEQNALPNSNPAPSDNRGAVQVEKPAPSEQKPKREEKAKTLEATPQALSADIEQREARKSNKTDINSSIEKALKLRDKSNRELSEATATQILKVAADVYTQHKTEGLKEFMRGIGLDPAGNTKSALISQIKSHLGNLALSRFKIFTDLEKSPNLEKLGEQSENDLKDEKSSVPNIDNLEGDEMLPDEPSASEQTKELKQQQESSDKTFEQRVNEVFPALKGSKKEIESVRRKQRDTLDEIDKFIKDGETHYFDSRNRTYHAGTDPIVEHLNHYIKIKTVNNGLTPKKEHLELAKKFCDSFNMKRFRKAFAESFLKRGVEKGWIPSDVKGWVNYDSKPDYYYAEHTGEVKHVERHYNSSINTQSRLYESAKSTLLGILNGKQGAIDRFNQILNNTDYKEWHGAEDFIKEGEERKFPTKEEFAKDESRHFDSARRIAIKYIEYANELNRTLLANGHEAAIPQEEIEKDIESVHRRYVLGRPISPYYNKYYDFVQKNQHFAESEPTVSDQKQALQKDVETSQQAESAQIHGNYAPNRSKNDISVRDRIRGSKEQTTTLGAKIREALKDQEIDADTRKSIDSIDDAALGSIFAEHADEFVYDWRHIDKSTNPEWAKRQEEKSAKHGKPFPVLDGLPKERFDGNARFFAERFLKPQTPRQGLTQEQIDKLSVFGKNRRESDKKHKITTVSSPTRLEILGSLIKKRAKQIAAIPMYSDNNGREYGTHQQSVDIANKLDSMTNREVAEQFAINGEKSIPAHSGWREIDGIIQSVIDSGGKEPYEGAPKKEEKRKYGGGYVRSVFDSYIGSLQNESKSSEFKPEHSEIAERFGNQISHGSPKQLRIVNSAKQNVQQDAVDFLDNNERGKELIDKISDGDAEVKKALEDPKIREYAAYLAVPNTRSAGPWLDFSSNFTGAIANQIPSDRESLDKFTKAFHDNVTFKDLSEDVDLKTLGSALKKIRTTRNPKDKHQDFNGGFKTVDDPDFAKAAKLTDKEIETVKQFANNKDEEGKFNSKAGRYIEDLMSNGIASTMELRAFLRLKGYSTSEINTLSSFYDYFTIHGKNGRMHSRGYVEEGYGDYLFHRDDKDPELEEALNKIRKARKRLNGPFSRQEDVDAYNKAVEDYYALKDKKFPQWKEVEKPQEENKGQEEKANSVETEGESQYKDETFDNGDSNTTAINNSKKRIQVKFKSFPSDETRAALKEAKFRWDPEEKVWHKALSDESVEQAKQLGYLPENYGTEQEEQKPKPTPPELHAVVEQRAEKKPTKNLYEELSRINDEEEQRLNQSAEITSQESPKPESTSDFKESLKQQVGEKPAEAPVTPSKQAEQKPVEQPKPTPQRAIQRPQKKADTLFDTGESAAPKEEPKVEAEPPKEETEAKVDENALSYSPEEFQSSPDKFAKATNAVEAVRALNAKTLKSGGERATLRQNSIERMTRALNDDEIDEGTLSRIYESCRNIKADIEGKPLTTAPAAKKPDLKQQLNTQVEAQTPPKEQKKESVYNKDNLGVDDSYVPKDNNWAYEDTNILTAKDFDEKFKTPESKTAEIKRALDLALKANSFALKDGSSTEKEQQALLEIKKVLDSGEPIAKGSLSSTYTKIGTIYKRAAGFVKQKNWKRDNSKPIYESDVLGKAIRSLQEDPNNKDAMNVIAETVNNATDTNEEKNNVTEGRMNQVFTAGDAFQEAMLRIVQNPELMREFSVDKSYTTGDPKKDEQNLRRDLKKWIGRSALNQQQANRKKQNSINKKEKKIIDSPTGDDEKSADISKEEDQRVKDFATEGSIDQLLNEEEKERKQKSYESKKNMIDELMKMSREEALKRVKTPDIDSITDKEEKAEAKKQRDKTIRRATKAHNLIKVLPRAIELDSAQESPGHNAFKKALQEAGLAEGMNIKNITEDEIKELLSDAADLFGYKITYSRFDRESFVYVVKYIKEKYSVKKLRFELIRQIEKYRPVVNLC